MASNYIQNWDKKGNIYYTNDKGEVVDFKVNPFTQLANKAKATLANAQDWINETDPNSEAYKQKIALTAGIMSMPFGLGAAATGGIAKGLAPYVGKKIAQSVAQGISGGVAGGAVEGMVDAGLNNENIAIGGLKGASAGALLGGLGGYGLSKGVQQFAKKGLQGNALAQNQYFDDYIADLANKTNAMAEYRGLKQGYKPTVGKTLHNFIGENAFNINKADLNTAKLMKNQGYTPDEIYDKTKWFQGVDEKWRTEIPYGEVNENPDLMKWQDIYVPEITEYSGKVGDIYNAPELYKNYPLIKDMDIYFKDTPENVGGYFDGKSITIDKNILPIKNPEYSQRIKELEATPEFKKYAPFLEDYNKAAEMEFLNTKVGEEWTDLLFDSVENMPQFLQKGDPRKLKEVLTHELQHQIQDYENFARGANANSPHYWSSAGEIEARKVGHRSNYPEDLLEKWKPYESHSIYDIDPAKQVVEFSGQEQFAKDLSDEFDYEKAIKLSNDLKNGKKNPLRNQQKSVKIEKAEGISDSDMEYLRHELNNNLTPKQRNKKVIKKYVGDHLYRVKNNGFDDYEFIGKESIDDILNN